MKKRIEMYRKRLVTTVFLRRCSLERAGKMYPQSFYLFKTFLRITRTTGFGKRYRISGISRESSRVHLLMLCFEVSRTSVFRLEHLIAAINRAFEHFLAGGMCRGDVCS